MRASADSWFRTTPVGEPILSERRELLEAFPARHAPWLPEAAPVLDGMFRWFGEADLSSGEREGAAAARKLGARWAPDFVLLRKDLQGEFRMVGGCICDPSSWDPADKLGRTVAEIHSPVPALNADLGMRIRTFLDRLTPDAVFVRENWGLAAVPDRNLHPALHRPRLVGDADPDAVWLRVEHQAFRAVPDAAGIVFVIWLTVHPLREVLAKPGVAALFCRSLESMPEPIAAYKGLLAARRGLVARIRAAVPDSFTSGSGLGSVHAQL